MANIRVKKTVSKKEDFVKAINTEFQTFVDPEQIQDNTTVEELFRLYNELFYEIPIEGDTNSHEFIIKESSKLVKFTSDTEDIQPLLDEISQLREQLLLVNQQLIETQTESLNNAAS